MNDDKQKKRWKQIAEVTGRIRRRRMDSSVPMPPHLPRLMWAEWTRPPYVRNCPVTQKVMRQLQWIEWDCLPLFGAERRPRERQIPLCAYVGAYLLKLEEGLRGFGQLHRYLRAHPGLLWALGFPETGSSRTKPFDPTVSLPTQEHFSRKLRRLPNGLLQNIIDEQVRWFKERYGSEFGQVVSVDTKHILAWVKENNPKQFIEEGRFDKTRQPAGDTDCKLGCKRRRNQVTPAKEGQPAPAKVSVGEYYWGYASGAAVTKIPKVGEVVLAELTETFDKGDATYFLPLMAQVEARLDTRPKYGTADAAFDAFYVYDYFHNEGKGGFAAVPLRDMKVSHSGFGENGRPLCEAELEMVLKRTFRKSGGVVQHRRGVYGCPLLHPEKTAESCPVNHKKWPNGGCQITMPTAAGARIRYELDRDSDEYKAIYKQRTAVERIFSQAVGLGIERPKLRNQQAITNVNTLTYILINLRTMQRIEESEKKNK